MRFEPARAPPVAVASAPRATPAAVETDAVLLAGNLAREQVATFGVFYPLSTPHGRAGVSSSLSAGSLRLRTAIVA